MLKKPRMLLPIFLTALVLASSAAAGPPVPRLVLEENAGSFVEYPLLTGLEDAAAQERINGILRLRGKIDEHLKTLSSLDAYGSVGLRVRSRAKVFCGEDGTCLLSALMEADGRMPQGRPGSMAAGVLLALPSGEEVRAENLFADWQEAAGRLDDILEEEIYDEISDYAELPRLSPVPEDNLYLDEYGITFLYAAERFSFLSGRSGAVHFRYFELEDLLDLSPGGLLPSLGLAGIPLSGADAAETIATACLEGRLPGIPVSLGDGLDECADRFGMSMDPEYFPLGTKYQLEGAEFRRNWLLGAEGSGTVDGFLSTRMDLYGIVTGRSDTGVYRALLGEPLASLPLLGAAAELYGLPEGLLETYQFGRNRLSFSCDEAGIVRAVMLVNDSL